MPAGGIPIRSGGGALRAGHNEFRPAWSAACDNLVAKITNFQSRRKAPVRSLRLS